MIRAYRISKANYAKDVLTGEGARIAGGRWNYPGDRIVYCSGSLALAALETLVHLGDDARRMQFVYLEIDIPDEVRLERLEHPSKGWRKEPPGEASMRVGTRWISEARGAVLEVPSALIPVEFNLLLNPEHPDFACLKVHRAKPFQFDPRMWS